MRQGVFFRCWIAAFLALAISSGPAQAVNRYFAEDKVLHIGFTGVNLTLGGDLDFNAYAFCMSLKYDPAKLRVTALNLTGSAAGAEWSDLKFDNATGDIIIGVILDMSPKADATDKVIPSGTNRSLIQVTLDVLSASPTTTLLDFRDRPPNPDGIEIKNILTTKDAASVPPALEDRTLAILSPAPSISNITDNHGTLGTEFYVIVDNLDVPGITTIGVEVCGKALVRDAADGFEVLGDGRTLLCRAPACGTVGWSPVKVTTNYGSDTEPDGFEYLQSFEPAIGGLANNEGQAGKVFQVTGTNFNRPGRTVTVCGKTAAATLRADNATLDVTAPDCALGWAVVKVCTNDGCDEVAQGFNYVTPATTFVRGDANNDGKIDLADAVSIFNDLFVGIRAFAPCRDALDVNDLGDLDLTDGILILNYLFQGGPQPKPPFPGPGIDTTQDNLPGC